MYLCSIVKVATFRAYRAVARMWNVSILHDCEWLQLVEALKYNMPLYKFYHKHSKITARMR